MSPIATYDTIEAHLADRRRAAPREGGGSPAGHPRGIGFVATIEIARPVDEVFAYVADFTWTPTWNYWVRSVRKTTPGPVGVGTTFHQVRRADEQDYRITNYEPPYRVTITTLEGSRPAFTRAIVLHPTPTGTHLTDRWQLDTGHPAWLQNLSAGRIRAAVTDNLARLAELLETGHTVLPDGRPVNWSGTRPSMT